MNDSEGAKKEYDELNKRTKRTIREDIRRHKINTVRQIMTESKSTRKMKKIIVKWEALDARSERR
ncbi:hypothetical protein C0J52_04478 [Blattella germanica]|nr:hypothetical protein C0J52_04478 [Blattella germanica]